MRKIYFSFKVMYRNYFVLNRLVLELAPLLNGAVIMSAFSQEKDKLILQLFKNEDEFFLELSLNPGNPYLIYRESFNRAKKNTVDFFNDYFPQKVESVQIAKDDRIIRFLGESGSFYFAIRGKFTNFYFVNNEKNISSFEKLEANFSNELAMEFSQKIYLNNFNILSFENYSNIETARTDFPIIGKEITIEYKTRYNDENSSEFGNRLKKLLSEIKEGSFSICVETSSGSVHLSPSSFSIFPFEEKEHFNSLIEALNFFLRKKFSLESVFSKKKLIVKFIDRELAKLSQRLNSIKTRIDRGNRESEYNKIANLLLINIYKAKHGANNVEVEDIYEENKIIQIKLDPIISAKKNVDVYFDKSKNERISYAKAQEMYTKVQLEFNRMKEYQLKAQQAVSIDEHLEIMKELKIKMDDGYKQKDDLKIKFKQYIVDEKYQVFVGKDSQNNDLLTTKFAKQNDYWFHARSVSGSHVVLRIDNTKETVPKSVLKKTASLAAYHSKAKTAGMVPVSYTFKKYVIKKKGMEAGKVALLKEDVLIVRPEIPPGCEYVSNE